MLVIAMTIMAFTGCKSSTEPTVQQDDNKTKESTPVTDKKPEGSVPEEVTIAWLTFETPAFTPEMYNEIIKGFEAEHPHIKIERQVYPTGDRDKYANTLMATEQLPDVLLEGLTDLRKVEGALLPLSEDITNLLREDAVVKYGNQVLDVPLSRQIKKNIYYNKSIFEKYGLVPPNNWEEFVAICDTLKAKGEVPIIGGGPDKAWLTGALIESMLQVDMKAQVGNFGKAVKNKDITWTDPAVVEIYDRWKSLIDSGYYHEGSFSFTYAQHVDEFFKGSAAMICNGGWMAKQADGAEGIEFEIGWFPVPGKDETIYYTAADSNFLGINAKTKHPEESKALIKFMFENIEANRLFNGNDGSSSTTKEPIRYEMGPIQEEMFNKAGEYEVAFYPFSGEFAHPKGMQNVIRKMAQDIFLGEDVGEQLEKLQQEYSQLLK